MSLSKYRQKRKFTKTSEPKGSLHKSDKKLEFVVQKHDASHLHYDFRLELDGVLKSWAVPKGPSLNPADKRLAMHVEDHPFAYRTFEGAIPKGNYGAGDVIVWDRGSYEPREPSNDPQKALRTGIKKGHLTFILHGQKLKGEFALVKSPHMEKNAWLLVKKDDRYASKQDVTKQTQSVLSGELLPADDSTSSSTINAPKSARPQNVKPMLATLTDAPFNDKDWLYEIKWDGYRAIASWDGQQAELYSRNGLDFSGRYTPVAEALRSLPRPCVLDGEVVVVDKSGKSHFELLQNYNRGADGELQYQVFDILWLDGRDLSDLPLIQRKELLRDLLVDNDVIRYSDHVLEQGRQFFASAQKAGLEGIIAKRTDSLYKENFRSKQWLKIKAHMRQEVVIGGFTEPKGSRQYIGALLVGIYKGGKFKYAGHVGGGIPPNQLRPLRQKLEKLERQTSPFDEKIKPNAPVHWVAPKLLCEVTFGEWTNDQRMRQPIFAGLRSDKNPKKVVKETPIPNPKKTAGSKSARNFEFTHLDKVFFPENKYTKGDLIKYYESVSDTMLPYLKDHPCNLLRQPNGYKSSSFFQKDMQDAVPDWVKTEAVYSESNQKELHYYVCDSKEALMYMVQLGCIEINPWSSRLKSLDKPDWAVIDLDPEGIGFDKVVEVANVVHDICEELKIPNYPKTSGKTGIHIFIPMGTKYTYDQVRQFAQLIATLAHERTQKITSLERDPKSRQHKIYIDYLQNRQSQTLAAPYSVRPTKQASVSTPLHWDEVNSKLDPAKFTIKNVPSRIKEQSDLWRPVLGKRLDLKKTIGLLEK